MTYRTYQILIAFGRKTKIVDIVAVDLDAAYADISAAYGDFTLLQYKVI